MNSRKFECEVKCPSEEEFGRIYPPYARFAKAGGRIFFNVIVTPESFIKMSVVSDLGFAATFAVAEKCSTAAKGAGQILDRYSKQFIGAVVCCLWNITVI